jgi:hypothetical protein
MKQKENVSAFKSAQHWPIRWNWWNELASQAPGGRMETVDDDVYSW